MNAGVISWLLPEAEGRTSVLILPLVVALLLGNAWRVTAQQVRPNQLLCISYRCNHVQREAVIERFEQTVLPRLEQWFGNDTQSTARLLIAVRGSSDNPWDVLLLLHFGSTDRYVAWLELERVHPAGLTTEEHRGITEIHTAWAETLADHPAPYDSASLVLVRPYSYTDPLVYPDYTRAYLVPEFESWCQANMLTGYAVLVNQFPQGNAWDIMLIQSYRNAEALGRRENVRSSTIDSLRADPAWILLHDGKGTYRTSNRPENVAVIARPVLATGRH